MPLRVGLSSGLGSTRRHERLGKEAILMGLTFEDEVRKAVVAIATPSIKGQGAVIVNPWRKPENRGTSLSCTALCQSEQLCADLRAGEGLLNVQTQ